VFWLRGVQLTDFGEKQNDRRMELCAILLLSVAHSG